MRFREMLSRLFSLFRRKHLDQELDAEHRYHLESLEAEHLARGLSPDEAKSAARRDFGSIVYAQQAYREQRGISIVETLVQDIRHAYRVLRRNVGFACLATMTLAIGIGSTATIFSFVDAVLLKPLPYDNADRIVRLLERRPNGTTSWISTPAYLEWKANNDTFEKIAAYQHIRKNRCLSTRSCHIDCLRRPDCGASRTRYRRILRCVRSEGASGAHLWRRRGHTRKASSRDFEPRDLECSIRKRSEHHW